MSRRQKWMVGGCLAVMLILGLSIALIPLLGRDDSAVVATGPSSEWGQGGEASGPEGTSREPDVSGITDAADGTEGDASSEENQGGVSGPTAASDAESMEVERPTDGVSKGEDVPVNGKTPSQNGGNSNTAPTSSRAGDLPPSGGTSGGGNAPSTGGGAGTSSTAAPATLAEKNARRISDLIAKYNVTVETGANSDVWQNQRKYAGITDENRIDSWLTTVEGVLSRYPVNFFRTFNEFSPTFKIKLVSTLPDKSGFSSYELIDDMYIAISCETADFTAARVINHEIMHMIDRYIQLKNWNTSNPLDATKALSPASEWGNTGSNAYTIYDYTIDVSERCFVSGYAKSNEREDRAETFADYMFRSYQQGYMGSASYPIVKKQRIIADTIRAYFPCCASYAQGSLPWEKWLI